MAKWRHATKAFRHHHGGGGDNNFSHKAPNGRGMYRDGDTKKVPDKNIVNSLHGYNDNVNTNYFRNINWKEFSRRSKNSAGLFAIKDQLIYDGVTELPYTTLYSNNAGGIIPFNSTTFDKHKYDETGALRRYKQGDLRDLYYMDINSRNCKMQWNRNVDQYINYDYHLDTGDRSRRSFRTFDITNKHIVVNTTHDTNVTGNHIPDNDIGYWSIDGNNGFMTYNHNHRLDSDTGHWDLRRSHWLLWYRIRCDNSFVVININADWLCRGWVADDTNGDIIKIEGSNTIVIINIFNGTFSSSTKLFPIRVVSNKGSYCIVNEYNGKLTWRDSMVGARL